MSKLVISNLGPRLEGRIDRVYDFERFDSGPLFLDIVIRDLTMLICLIESNRNGSKVAHAIEIGTWRGGGIGIEKFAAFPLLPLRRIGHAAVLEIAS